MNQPIIMTVDDEPMNLAVYRSILKPYFRIQACESGEQALSEAVKQPQPDLILLDVMMSGKDGYEVLGSLRRDEKTRDIPVIFVTGKGESRDEEKGLKLGAVDYIAKPVTPALLLARIRTHLEIKHSRDWLRDQNVWLEQEVNRRTLENTLVQDVSLMVILELVETRDEDTGNHITRTQAYIELLGQQLQNNPKYTQHLTDEVLSRIVKSSSLHDIGKIGVPDRILLKPGALDAEEWRIMKHHARLGADTIRRAIGKSYPADVYHHAEAKPESLKILEEALDIALYHHERWDGTGYPEGLKGEEIPLSAKLMAIADVYDALTTRRSYKEAQSAEEAAGYIFTQRGRHFAPDVIDAFAQQIEPFKEIQHRFADEPGNAQFSPKEF